MTDPYLVLCLVELRAEFDIINPHRDRGADGWIGDVKHQAEKSDHNPDASGRVLAVDIDSTGPWDGEDFYTMVMALVYACYTGVEYRVEYIIWDHYIYRRSNFFLPENYTGNDPHTGHAHISGRHDHAGENDTRSWNVQGDDMTDTQIAKLAKAIADAIMHSDTVPYTAADGTKDTWQLATAVGYMLGKSRIIADNTTKATS